jgi:hypothetical protein
VEEAVVKAAMVEAINTMHAYYNFKCQRKTTTPNNPVNMKKYSNNSQSRPHRKREIELKAIRYNRLAR